MIYFLEGSAFHLFARAGQILADIQMLWLAQLPLLLSALVHWMSLLSPNAQDSLKMYFGKCKIQ